MLPLFLARTLQLGTAKAAANAIALAESLVKHNHNVIKS